MFFVDRGTIRDGTDVEALFDMISLSKYLRVPVLIFSFLFLLGFSGIHTVLHTCEMEGMTCCDEMIPQDQRTTAAPIVHNQLIPNGMTDCCVWVPVSDFESTATDVVTTGKSSEKINRPASFVTPTADLTPRLSSTLSSIQSLRLNQATPPTVATYILTASLLI